MAIHKLKPAVKTETFPESLLEGLTALPMPVLLWKNTVKELWANDEFVRMFGTVESHRFDKAKAVHALQSRPIHLDLFSSIGRHEGLVLKNTRGESIPVELKVGPCGGDKNTFLVVLEEVAAKVELQQELIQTHLELKKSQDALIQSSKLASLGELSSGIAHELNQPLQAILGFGQELTQMEKLSATGTEFLNDILSAAHKMKEIIRSLRTFAHESGDKLAMTSVEHAVLEAEKLMHHQLLQLGIAVEIKSAKDLPMVMANEIQLEQVIVNLMGNARDAIEQTKKKNGKIIVELKNSKKGLVLTVKDNGCGMSKETQAKMFDPFFTTKEVGKGTGLGLSISYGILKRFNAEIGVESEVNQGTSFTLTFPKENKI